MKKNQEGKLTNQRRPIDYLTVAQKNALLMIRQFHPEQYQGIRMTYEEYLIVEKLLAFQKEEEDKFRDE